MKPVNQSNTDILELPSLDGSGILHRLEWAKRGGNNATNKTNPLGTNPTAGLTHY